LRKKLFVALLFALVFLLGALPAFAESPGLDGITTFGYSDLRDRSDFSVNSLGFWASWMSDFGQNIGTSYSQPLIVHDPNGNEDMYVDDGVTRQSRGEYIIQKPPQNQQ